MDTKDGKASDSPRHVAKTGCEPGREPGCEPDCETKRVDDGGGVESARGRLAMAFCTAAAFIGCNSACKFTGELEEGRVVEGGGKSEAASEEMPATCAESIVFGAKGINPGGSRRNRLIRGGRHHCE